MPKPLSLPDAPHEKLPRSPLRLVVCQVRHERILAVADISRALEVHEAVRSAFPNMEELTEEKVDMVVGVAGSELKRSEPQTGWRFQSEDQKWTAVITQSSFSVETLNYNRWVDFKDNLDRLARAFENTFSPKLEKRLGLRMVDHIEYPFSSKPEGFRGLIADEILGPIVSRDFSDSVRATQSLVELEGPDGTTVNLQHGCQLFGETYSYVLDHDCFRQIGKPFNVGEILEMANKFHDLVKRVFRTAITDSLYDYFRKE